MKQRAQRASPSACTARGMPHRGLYTRCSRPHSSCCHPFAGLPFALARAGVDPANAGTSIQVIMDVTGVLLTCSVCHLILDQLAASLGSVT